MGETLRKYDWSALPRGSPDAWPQSLKAVVGVMLATPQALLLCWGVAQLMP